MKMRSYNITVDNTHIHQFLSSILSLYMIIKPLDTRGGSSLSRPINDDKNHSAGIIKIGILML